MHFFLEKSVHWKQGLQRKLIKTMEEMPVYGGYPAVLTAKSPDKRKEQQQEI